MKKKVQMKKMAGVFLTLAILGIGLFPPGTCMRLQIRRRTQIRWL